MGFDKTLTPVAGRPPLERVLSALGDRAVVVVVPSSAIDTVATLAPNARIAVNDDPERGMAYSLRCALKCIARTDCVGVIQADMPAITEAIIQATEAMLRDGIDVAYPVTLDGIGGHPVIFSAAMRECLEHLPDGDTLRCARDAAITRATWMCTDVGAFLDLDDPNDWRAFSDA